MNEESKEEELNCMCIGPDGEIFDCYLNNLPSVGQRLQLGKRSFYVTEAHESASPQFLYVITLRRG